MRLALVSLMVVLLLTGCISGRAPADVNQQVGSSPGTTTLPTETTAKQPSSVSEQPAGETPATTNKVAAPVKQSRIWALDPSGKTGLELLFAEDRPFLVAGSSPDGRYVLLVQRRPSYKGDPTAVPFLWDRAVGRTVEGQQMSVRFARWSGKGFFVDWLTSLDLTLGETQFDSLRRLLNLKEGEREVIASSFSPDGTRFAALVGHSANGESLDLVLANSDGTNLIVMPSLVIGNGGATDVALAPDGQNVAVAGKNGAAIGPTSGASSDQWIRLQSGGGGYIAWAPDSKHLWFPGAGVFDLVGKLVFDPGPVHGLVWRPDGQGGLTYGFGSSAPFLRSFRLDGTATDITIPEYMIPSGFLPDGRIMVWRTITE